MVQFVTNEDLLKAYMRWSEASPLKDDGSWSAFLGHPTGFPSLPPYPAFQTFKWEVPDIGAERVRLLCDSPHWYAIVRAIVVKETAEIFER